MTVVAPIVIPVLLTRHNETDSSFPPLTPEAMYIYQSMTPFPAFCTTIQYEYYE